MKTDNTMTAEQQWKEWARGRVTPDNPVVTGSVVFGIKAYKSALRKAIEVEKKIIGYHRRSCKTNSEFAAYENQLLVIDKILELMYTVLPNNPE